MAVNFTYDPRFPFNNFQEGAIISHAQMAVIDYVYIAVTFLLSSCGIVTNSLNIKAFLLMGKIDGVKVSLVSLSISDLGFCILSFVLILSLTFARVQTNYDGGNLHFFIDPWIPFSYAMYFGYAFYAATNFTTTFLAFARCMCVARPLHFGNTFTKSRSVGIQIAFALISLGGYVPVLTQMGTRKTVDVLHGNRTQITLWFSDKRDDVKNIVFLVFDTIVSFTSLGVLFVCVIIMTRSLRKSGKFRHAIKMSETSTTTTFTSSITSTTTSPTTVPTTSPTPTTTTTTSNNTEKDAGVKQPYKLGGKELQVIHQVVLISIMCLLAALPKIFSAVYCQMDPRFDLGKRFHNFYFAMDSLRRTFELVNSASTFFIYYKYNSKFRAFYNGHKRN